MAFVMLICLNFYSPDEFDESEDKISNVFSFPFAKGKSTASLKGPRLAM